jgi:hypothetical protein
MGSKSEETEIINIENIKIEEKKETEEVFINYLRIKR